EWNGYRKPQLFIEDVGIDEWQLFDWRHVKDPKEKINELPKEKRVLVVFHERTIDRLELKSYQEEIILIDDLKSIDVTDQYVVLLDLPTSASSLQSLFSANEVPERIYAVFFQEDSQYFSTLPK